MYSFLYLLFLILAPFASAICKCYTATSYANTCQPQPTTCPPIIGTVISLTTIPAHVKQCETTSTVTHPTPCPTPNTCTGDTTLTSTVSGKNGCYTSTLTEYLPCPSPIDTVTKKNGMTSYKPCPPVTCTETARTTVHPPPPKDLCACPTTKTLTYTEPCSLHCQKGCATVTKTTTVV